MRTMIIPRYMTVTVDLLGGIMERLTKRDSYGDVYVKQHDYVTASEKLCEYEDLEEQGLLLKLPCKVGDTVYHVVQGRIVEVSNVDLFFLLLSVAENRFNNSVFLTQAEAKQKLKEMEGGNNGTMES